MSQQRRTSTSSSPTLSQPALPPRSDKTNSTDAERGWIFHRNREQPTPDPKEPPINQIKFYLDRYKIKEALQIFFDKNTLKLLRVESDFMWDIVSLICKRLRGLCQYRFRVFEGCERMLCRIAVDENCNPKEVLISLLAEISQHDQFDDDNVFRAMIRPLEGTLFRMNHPSPRDENLRWVMNVLLQHIHDIELPQECNLEGKKRLSLSNDPYVKRFTEILPLMLSFIEEFNDRPIDFDNSPMALLTESQIDEVLNGELADDDLLTEHNSSMTDSLDASVTTILSLIYRPLAFLDLTTYCADLRQIANKCLNTLLKLRPNLLSQIYKRIQDKLNIKETESLVNNINGSCNDTIISLATCSYLYRCERVVSFETVQSFPQIISHEFILWSHIPYIVGLLERPEILVHEKGLILLESILRRLNRNTLDQKFLDAFITSSLNQQLFKIMVFSPLCTNRRRAYNMFTSICDLLTYDCKIKMFQHVLTQTDLRPCIRAACIDLYRKHLTHIYRELMNLHQQRPPWSTNSSYLTNLVEPIRRTEDNYVCEKEMDSKTVDGVFDIIEDSNVKSQSGRSFLQVTDPISIQIRSLHTQYKSLGGLVLVEFLDHCIKACLPDSQHTDIIENYELLLATLTMFRFLKLRKTIFKDDVEEEYLCGHRLKKIFFDPLRSAIAMIISELKLHHKDIVDGHKMKNTKITQSSILNVTQSRNELDLLSRILGPKMDDILSTEAAELSDQDEADCLNWALCRLDLVESVLVRTSDLYNC